MGKAVREELSRYFDLEGRIAVITGGGGELCGCMARGLAGLGARVAILDISMEKAQARAQEIAAGGGVARAFGCSVMDAGQLAAVYEEVASQWGTPQFLINGAGGNDPRGSTGEEFLEREHLADPSVRHFLGLEIEGVRSTFDLNFLGTLIPTQVFSRGMVEKGKGSIVNISSMNALTPLTKIPAYSAAKAAVANFTRWLAVHLAHTGVRVNALAPGFFMTEQLRFLHIDQKTGEPTDRARKVIAHTPLGRYGEPEDLLGVVIWLLSDSSSFVTGALIPVDGGFSSYAI
jgi:NAD(P)-dependent dehydrogenase (short-subunit alcohol dehydrogenase family)